MRLFTLFVVALLAACSDTDSSQAAASTREEPSSAASARPAQDAKGSNGRRGELANPEDSAMVLLYFDLAGLAAPLDRWVEDDSRVQMAPGAQKASRRQQVRAELEATTASVRDVGVIRLSMNSQLSEYDPTYNEFTILALSPSSTVTFKAFGQQVSLRFGNARTAQVWALPAEQAQAITDALDYGRHVSLDLLLEITAVQPSPGGGTVIADVLEYELRSSRTHRLLNRVRLTRS